MSVGSGSGSTSGEADSITTGPTNPATADAGDVFFNSADGVLYVYDGSSWQASGGAGSVDSSSIADGSISSADLASGAVTSAAIADGSITGTDISDSSIGLAKLSSGCSNNQILVSDASGNLSCASAPAGDNLGNHIATQNLDLGANSLVGNGGSAGIAVDASGNVGIGEIMPATALQVNGVIKFGTAASPSRAWELTDTAAGFAFRADPAYSSGEIKMQGRSIGGSGDYFQLRIDDSSSAAYPNYTFFSDTNTGFRNDPSTPDQVYISTAGANRLTVDPTGNVGIGTTSPTKKFVVSNGSNEVVGISSANNVGSAADILFDQSGSIVAEHSVYITGGADGVTNGAIIFKHGAEGTSVSTENVRITASGRLGIGTTAPGAKLQVGHTADGQLSELYFAGQYGTHEGLWFGKYSANGGAKIDLNSHASATESSSWRIESDTDQLGYHKLAFSFAGPSESLRVVVPFA